MFVYDENRLVRPVTSAAGRFSGEQIVLRLAPPPATSDNRRAVQRRAPLPRGIHEPRTTSTTPRAGEGTWRGTTVDADHKNASKAVEAATAKVDRRTQSSLARRRARATAAERLIAAARKELARSSKLAADDKRRKDHHKAARKLAARAEKSL